VGIYGDVYTGSAEYGVIAFAPEVHTAAALERPQMESGLVIHQPNGVPAVLSIKGKEQGKHVIKAKRGRALDGYARFRALIGV
jgi:hypothetical protein